MKTVNIAIFASGSGTNAENIANYFKTNKNFRVKLILSNNENAFVLKRAQNLELNQYLLIGKIFMKVRRLLIYW
jgi:phosphoribosylglycinamide formyltransferase-1